MGKRWLRESLLDLNIFKGERESTEGRGKREWEKGWEIRRERGRERDRGGKGVERMRERMKDKKRERD